MIKQQAFPINFSQGIDTKTDEKQVQVGKFLSLVNSIFLKGGLLQKRNGFKALPKIPNSASYATTFNGDLTVIGDSIQTLPTNSSTWVDKGAIQPLSLSVLPLIRNNFNQTQVDTAIAPNGFVCTVYTETDGNSNFYKYAVADSVTGQNIIAPTIINGADPILGTPRVFVLGGYFIVVYTATVSTVNHLVYIAINTSTPSIVTAQATISISYTAAPTVSFDGVVFDNRLFLAWMGAGSTGMKMLYMTTALTLSSTKNIDMAHSATMVTLCADEFDSVIWVSYYFDGTSGWSLATDININVLPGYPVEIISSGDVFNIASAAQFGLLTVFYEQVGPISNFVLSITVTQASTIVTSPVVVLRSVGLASKAFIVDSVIYFLGAYSSTFQPTYFLVNGLTSTSANPAVIAKIAYENGGGYLTTGLPSVFVSGLNFSIPYLYKDLVQALANSNDAGTTVSGGVYSQTGINLASFIIGSNDLITTEIGSNLNITGGFLWAYDGYSIVEQGFHLFPEPITASHTSMSGFLTAQIYFYQITYEWTDNQGNAFRSAGSVPLEVDISASMTSTNKVTLTIPTLRITAKIANPVKIVIYRWSTAQPVFYQTTSILAPTLNNPTVDSISYVDINADTPAENSSHFILGNNILYTTGGVVEDIGGPAFKNTFLFDDRLWGITSEDNNLLWFSKQVIEGTPVELSDLLTLYVAPNISSQGPSGGLVCGFPMDDKAVLFKKSTLLYINGTGPDNTGANSQYSQPLFITSTVGCSNQYSIVFIPQGLMFEFQSEAGNQIWLLGRDLSTQYIGAPVEGFTTNATVLSAVNIPGTNQVRFAMSSGITLMYDYYYGQWGTFVNIPATSSTLYQGLHTYINSFNQVFQESPGIFLDGSSPVLMSFLTGHIQLQGISGYQRLFELQFLGQYVSPHLLNVQLGYDFAPLSEQALITPINSTGVYGSDSLYGQTSPYGGSGSLEQWRVQNSTQKCQAFQVSLQEVYDSSMGVPAGAGFTMSAMTVVLGLNRGYRPVKAATTIGTS